MIEQQKLTYAKIKLTDIVHRFHRQRERLVIIRVVLINREYIQFFMKKGE